MDNNELVRRIDEAVAILTTEPGQAFAKKTDAPEFKKGEAGIIALCDYLRTSAKYVRFDLEAARRENDYLRKLIEDKSG